MTAQELLSSLLSRGYQLSVKGENVLVTGGEVTPELRYTLLRFKADLLPLLAPQQSFINVRSKLTALEKQLGGQGPEPQPMWILFHHRDHDHTEAEIEATKRRIWTVALERYYATRDESDLGLIPLHIGLQFDGRNGCAVCKELSASSVSAQEPQQ